MKKAVRWAAVCSVATVCWVSTASAGPKDDELKARREVAGQLHQEGATLYSEGKFEAARAKFHEAYARSQNPNSLFNEARCTLRSGHPLEAAKLLKIYAALPENDKVTAQDRKEAHALVEEASAKLCTLDVRVSSCVVDGNPEQGTALVEVGEHIVRMKGPQGERTKTVSCTARQTVIVTYDDPTQGPIAPPPGERGETGSWLVPAVLAGVGVAGLAVGIGLGASSSGPKNDTIAAGQAGACADASSSRCATARDTESKANGLATGSVIGYVGGGVFLAASAVSLAILTPWKERPARVQVSPTVGGLVFHGQF